MKEDPTEQTDLAASEPAMLKQLKERYAQLRATQLDQTYVEYFAVACGYGPPKPGRSYDANGRPIDPSTGETRVMFEQLLEWHYS